MNAPNRSSAVAAWVTGHRDLFVSRHGMTADDVRRELLIPLAQHLNVIEGRNAWARLVKNDQGNKIPHDILVWKETHEHYDVFTGTARVEDTKPAWGFNPPWSNPQWQALEVADVPFPHDVIDEPSETPTESDNNELLMRIATLEGRILPLEEQMRELLGLRGTVISLVKKLEALENAPAPTFELPELIAEGTTGRVWGHGHPVTLAVRAK